MPLWNREHIEPGGSEQCFAVLGKMKTILQRARRLPCHAQATRCRNLTGGHQIEKVARGLRKCARARQPGQLVEEEAFKIFEIGRATCRRDQDTVECLRSASVFECLDGAPCPLLRIFAASEMVDERATAACAFERHQLN